VARHPETKEPIVAGIGRFGPYVQHGKVYASLTRDDDVLSIGANRAIDLIITKEQGGGGRFGSTEPGRPLGDHPDGGPVSVKSGKFGSYVNWGKINATIPKGTNAEGLTLPDAIALLAAKASAAPAGGKVLGEHTAGGPITLRDGRYGAYVSHGKVNATIPKDTPLDTVTLEDAIRWIDDKGGPDKKLTRKAPKKGAAKTSAAVKKPTAKKPAVKVDDDDEPPFDVDETPKAKVAARKAPAKAAAKKSAAKKKAPAKKKAAAKKK
jgi:DNA topoisomerase-1